MDPNTYQIFIRVENGRHCVLDVSQLTTVAQIRSQLCQRRGIPLPFINLVYHGKYLTDNQTIGQLQVPREATLNMSLRTPRSRLPQNFPSPSGPHPQTSFHTSGSRQIKKPKELAL